MNNLLALSVKDPSSDKLMKINIDNRIPTGGIEGAGGLESIIQNGIILLLVIASILALAYLLWGGVGWITSGGDKTKVQAARNKMVYAIIGLVICLLAFGIVSVVMALFGVEL